MMIVEMITRNKPICLAEILYIDSTYSLYITSDLGLYAENRHNVKWVESVEFLDTPEAFTDFGSGFRALTAFLSTICESFT